MTEFWESAFKDRQTMWGFEPADCVIDTLQLFQDKGLKKILIPGFWYGRNAQSFTDNGFDVTGIEISGTAIDLAKEHYWEGIKVFHGGVDKMPYDIESYDGIFCYALVHLLGEKERIKFISDCYDQLNSGGYMVFVSLSTNDTWYGKWKFLSKDRFLSKHGVELFYYNSNSIKNDFEKYGLIETKEIIENSQKFWQITCKK